MKHLFAFLLLSIAFLPNAKSQDSVKSTSFHVPVYFRIKVNTIQGQVVKGPSVFLNDSSISIFQRDANKRSITKPDPLHKTAFTGDTALDNKYYTTNNYYYKSIKTVHVTNRRLRTWTIVSGMVIGTVVGALIGHSNGDDSGFFGASANTKAWAGGILGFGVGALTGAILSAALEKRYMIDGEWKSFEELKASLKH